MREESVVGGGQKIEWMTQDVPTSTVASHAVPSAAGAPDSTGGSKAKTM